jgi:hypothetical protein
MATYDQESPSYRYRQWAGQPQGVKQDLARCVVEVWPNDGSYLPSQCQRKRGHGRGGFYCKQHARQFPAVAAAHGTEGRDDG